MRRTLGVNILSLWQPEYKLLSGKEIRRMGAETPLNALILRPATLVVPSICKTRTCPLNFQQPCIQSLIGPEMEASYNRHSQ